MRDFGNLLLERCYHIPLTMFDSAFRTFQKKYVVPRNIILSVVLAAVAGVYVAAAIRDPEQTLAYLLMAVCVALILSTWYKMFKLRRAVHTALADVENDEYRLRVYDGGLVISTEDRPAEQPAAENTPQQAPEQADPQPDGNGFQQIFPEEPPQPAEKAAPTEISFGSGIRIHEMDAYFMVYIIRQNFYVIPKKDFTEQELTQLRTLFAEKLNR